MIFISQINMAYCDAVTDMYIGQIRETMYQEANNIDNRSDKDKISRKKIMRRIQQEVDEKSRRINKVQLIASSFGGVIGSLLAASIHFMDSNKLLISYSAPELCFGTYSGMQILLFISGACLVPDSASLAEQDQ